LDVEDGSGLTAAGLAVAAALARISTIGSNIHYPLRPTILGPYVSESNPRDKEQTKGSPFRDHVSSL
jgi:hypothetical protein